MDLSVKYDTLQLSREMLVRQAGQHLTNMKSFTQQWCKVNPGDAGLVGKGASKAVEASEGTAVGQLFQKFMPLNDDLAGSGERSLDDLIKLHEGAADAMGKTIDTYAETDEFVYNALAKILNTLGVSTEPFSDPRDNPVRLGAAEHAAKSTYAYGGEGEPNLIGQSAIDTARAIQYHDYTTRRRATQEARAASSDRSMNEVQDASSFLVPPEAPSSEMEDLRWSAGAILGSIDWVIEQLTGKSLLNELIFKHLIGDWKAVQKAGIAWKEISDAAVAVGQNDSEILPALSEWTGNGSESAISFIKQLSENTTAFHDVATFFSSTMSFFASALKAAAAGIGAILKFISNMILKLLAKLAVPVAGWLAAGIDVALSVNKVIGQIKLAYTLVNILYDTLSKFVAAKAKGAEIEYILANMAEAQSRREAAVQ